MEARTGELEMVEILAKLTTHHLKLVRDVPALVSEKAEQLIVHVAFSENFNECLVSEGEKHRKLKGFDLILGSNLRNKV